MVPTNSEWTAIFDSGWQGSDAAMVMFLSNELRCQGLRVELTQEVKVKGVCRRYGGRIFELYEPMTSERSRCVRSIGVINDGGRWVMDVAGEPLSGEKPEWLTAKRIRDRFMEEHLVALLQSVGVDAFNEHFYKTEGMLIEHHGPTAVGYREYDLREVQAQWTGGGR